MKIGIITFHRSHNYGSMLQAYALQQVLLNEGYECETIDFSTKRQKKLYALPWKKGHWAKRILKYFFYLRVIKSLKKKYKLFEDFLYNYIRLSPKSYETTSELCNLDYDIIISGSDQIWNVTCYDFDWAYYIDFPFDGKKISYAVSMGSGRCKQAIETTLKNKLFFLLNQYHSILVREVGTQTIIKDLFKLNSVITLDPTFLLESNEWERMAGDIPLIEDDYILYYTPQYRPDAISCVEKIGIITGIPIIETLHIKNRTLQNFQLKLDIGPKEFLNLIRYAKIVVGASFHVIVFSILFKKSFWAVNSLNDNRKSNILKLLHLEHRNITSDSVFQQIENDMEIDYDNVYSLLEKQKEQSLKLLFEAIS